MAHECQECGMTCHCGGDIDDICFSGTTYEARCTHCDGNEEDFDMQPISPLPVVPQSDNEWRSEFWIALRNDPKFGPVLNMTLEQLVATHVGGIPQINDAAARENVWQPIETAPKDGQRLLLWSPNFVGGSHIAQYVDIEGDANGPHCWPYIPCTWTHWMPLPAAPEQP